MAIFELECFLSKFRCLSIAGYEATLNISCKAGQTYVSLNANLRQLHSQSTPPINPTPPGFNPCRKHRGPAYFRRQIKRKFRENDQYFENDAAVNSTEEENCEPPINIDIAEIVKNVNESTLSIQDQASTDTNLNKDSSDACTSEIIERCCDHMDESQNMNVNLHEVSLLEATPSVSFPADTCVNKKELNLPQRYHIHICRPSKPPSDDNKCSFHCCRPGWTLEERARNHNGDIALLYQSIFGSSSANGYE